MNVDSGSQAASSDTESDYDSESRYGIASQNSDVNASRSSAQTFSSRENRAGYLQYIRNGFAWLSGKPRGKNVRASSSSKSMSNIGVPQNAHKVSSRLSAKARMTHGTQTRKGNKLPRRKIVKKAPGKRGRKGVVKHKKGKSARRGVGKGTGARHGRQSASGSKRKGKGKINPKRKQQKRKRGHKA